MADRDGASPSPVELLKSTPAPDDVGAATADRFEWQSAMATADLLGAYLDVLDSSGVVVADAAIELVCEHHEDWVLIINAEPQLVSAKHREVTQGAITTMRLLLDEAGVLHLFLRWQALGETPRCRLVTTAGLAGACRGLRGTLGHLKIGAPNGSAQTKIVGSFEGALSPLLARERARGTTIATATREQVIKFLSVLSIDEARIPRQHLPYAAANAFALPVAERLGCPSAADAIWTATLSLVRERMRGAGPTGRAALPALRPSTSITLTPRTITLSDLDLVVRLAVTNQNALTPLPRVTRNSRVALKMIQGGCSDNTVERAEHLRAQYKDHLRDAHSLPMPTVDQRKLENHLLKIAERATSDVKQNGHPWGERLWRRIEDELDTLTDPAFTYGLDTDLLLGGVCDLSDRCRVWFSDRFDMDSLRANPPQRDSSHEEVKDLE